ncbi:MAG: YifB family Mg chelatase-like AAA ATPase [Cellvibrionaceae bacterium]
MSLAIVHTRARLGIDAPTVTVEVHLSNGLPGLSIVGLPETAVKESKDRVRSALINSQFDFPARRITINLAPADLPKDGGRFDLAIAIGILAASEQIPDNVLNDFEFIGELALSGELRAIHGILPAAIACGKSKRKLILPCKNTIEASLCETTQMYSAESLLAVCAHLQQKNILKKISFKKTESTLSTPDFSDVYGQKHVKRALEIAAAGGHNVLLYGPPGTGKTMLASRLPSIMPPLEQSQAIDVASIHSLCGHHYPHWQLPPFRNPHHTASAVALVGGGSHPQPGEISLAHHGVLFLDELPEFQRHVLEVLREPLESGEIRISRATAQLIFPAQFQLVAAMNPCPCGYLSSPTQHHRKQRCTCTQEQIQRYRQKISGPLLDRIDLHIPVTSIPIDELHPTKNKKNTSECSANIRQRVIEARKKQQQRQQTINAKLSTRQLASYCNLGEEEKALLNHAMEKLALSGRAYHRIIKVARTIADLENAKEIRSHHIAESLSLRNFDR